MHPHLKKQDKDNHLICQAQPGALEAETFQKKPQEYVWLAEQRGTNINCATTPHPLLCPRSLSCVQIGLNIVVPLCRAVGKRLANMFRVCKGMKRNVWRLCHQYKTTVKLQKEKVACDAKILTAREFSYLFSAESRQREERWDRLPKIHSGGWDWSGCEVIGLGARVAKIKQVCSVTTRGGEKERGGKRREREWGRGLTPHWGPRQLVEDSPPFFAARTEVEGRKGEGVDIEERYGKKEEERVGSGSNPGCDIW